MPTAALVIGAVATVGGTYASYRAQKKAADAQKQQQEVSTRRSRRQAIRSAQFARAQSVAAASAAGATGSSASQGGQSSVGSQLGEQLGFSTQMSGLSNIISQQSLKATQANAVASIGSTVMSLGYNAGGATKLKGMFDKKPTQAPTTLNASNFNPSLYGGSAYPNGAFS